MVMVAVVAMRAMMLMSCMVVYFLRTGERRGIFVTWWTKESLEMGVGESRWRIAA